jgi:hypothetical protein
VTPPFVTLKVPPLRSSIVSVPSFARARNRGCRPRFPQRQAVRVTEHQHHGPSDAPTAMPMS